jgi:hypothetical protein
MLPLLYTVLQSVQGFHTKSPSKESIWSSNHSRKINYVERDKTLGLRLRLRSALTPSGAEALTQCKRDSFYLYGVVEPLTGQNFILEFTHLDTICNEQCF